MTGAIPPDKYSWMCFRCFGQVNLAPQLASHPGDVQEILSQTDMSNTMSLFNLKKQFNLIQFHHYPPCSGHPALRRFGVRGVAVVCMGWTILPHDSTVLDTCKIWTESDRYRYNYFIMIENYTDRPIYIHIVYTVDIKWYIIKQYYDDINFLRMNC